MSPDSRDFSGSLRITNFLSEEFRLITEIFNTIFARKVANFRDHFPSKINYQ